MKMKRKKIQIKERKSEEEAEVLAFLSSRRNGKNKRNE